ncbi:AbrB/MazE/SpoVT family DNA-binding domain-containing protein [Methanobrevibacter oralis]|uniref:SpoVT / AbrB like domain protein n=1 Tax=Methanobrevibacter oralis TaxID=66851 RepID=A0A166AQ83_METOA|nr:AbrB/MazE/SpoVT family DNA-binding domain-containing protein [Methanobrevibacter oralis]KZX12333.1 SpoVT / AbrB like domain protein [Methanobrevibacter oralis]
MVNVGVTKVYKNNQTTIPSKVRKELNISENSIISWDLNPDKTITISVKSEKPSVKDLVGLGSSKEVTNAVNLKRGLYL